MKTAQTTLGHSEATLTLGVDAQAVVTQGETAAEAMGARFLLAQWTCDGVRLGHAVGLTGIPMWTG